jgi:hypothetical protein
MAGNATLTIVPSRMTITMPVQSTASASHRDLVGSSSTESTVSDLLVQNYLVLNFCKFSC